MSAIASFYLIRDDLRPMLVEAAEAQSLAIQKRRWGIFRAKLPLDPDPFWGFLERNARELGDYPYSGYLLLDLEMMAPKLLSSMDSVGQRLSEIKQSTFVTYRPDDASRALEILASADFSDRRIKTFLDEAQREHEYPDIVAPIQDSLRRLKEWLGAVTDGHTGVLHVG